LVRKLLFLLYKFVYGHLVCTIDAPFSRYCCFEIHILPSVRGGGGGKRVKKKKSILLDCFKKEINMRRTAGTCRATRGSTRRSKRRISAPLRMTT
jgi:hypothetical protein